MGRFHINGKGEPGSCSAQPGNCPFGEESHHYDSPEKARQAFELSMASQTQAPTHVKKRVLYPEKGDKIKVHDDAAVWDSDYKSYAGREGTVTDFNGSSYTVKFDDGKELKLSHQLVDFAVNSKETATLPTPEEYKERINEMSTFELLSAYDHLKTLNPSDSVYKNLLDNAFKNMWGGFAPDDLVFNREKEKERLLSYPNWQNADHKTLEGHLNELEEHWNNQARTRLPVNGERNVPIRLLPTGTEVYAPFTKGGPWKKVGVPADNGVDPDTGLRDVAGKYWDGVQWDYVSENTSFTIGKIPPGKNVSPRWKQANDKAAALAGLRSLFSSYKYQYEVIKDSINKN